MGKASKKEESFSTQLRTLTAKCKEAEVALSSQRGQSPNCRRRWTGLKTTCWGPRRRTRRWRRRWRPRSRISRTYELVHEKEKFKAISDELDQTFAEMSGY